MNNSDLADLIDGAIESIDCYFDRWRTYCNRTYPADPLPPFDQEFKEEQHRDYLRLTEARTQALNAAKSTGEAMALLDEDCAGLLRFHHFVSARNSHLRRGTLDMERYRQSIGSLDGRSGPETAYPLWPDTKVSLQRLSIRLRMPVGPKTNGEQDEKAKGKPSAKNAGTSEANRPDLPPSRQKAYSQYRHAIGENAALDGAADRNVYDWLEKNLDDGEQLPSFASWSKYLREARAAHGLNKNQPRNGRKIGKSIVRPDQV